MSKNILRDTFFRACAFAVFMAAPWALASEGELIEIGPIGPRKLEMREAPARIERAMHDTLAVFNLYQPRFRWPLKLLNKEATEIDSVLGTIRIEMKLKQLTGRVLLVGIVERPKLIACDDHQVGYEVINDLRESDALIRDRITKSILKVCLRPTPNGQFEIYVPQAELVKGRDYNEHEINSTFIRDSMAGQSDPILDALISYASSLTP